MREPLPARRFVPRFPLALLAPLLAASPVAAGMRFEQRTEVVVRHEGQVLHSEEANTSKGNGTSGQTDSDNGDAGEGSTAATETRLNVDGTNDGTHIRIEERTEVRGNGTIRVRTSTSGSRARTEVVQNGVKVRLERTDDRLRVTLEDKNGQQREISADDPVTIDEQVDGVEIRIRTLRPTEGHTESSTVIEQENTQALTSLSLAVNADTKALTVTTPAGERTVTVLPAQAVENLLAANVLDEIDDEELAMRVRDGGADARERVIVLAEQDGIPAFEIRGVKAHRLFGVFPVTTTVTAVVSAETGDVLEKQQSLLDTIIDFLSAAV